MSNFNDGNQPPSGDPQNRPNPDWQQGQPGNPWQNPPETRKPYVPDRPPSSGGANDWAYEHPHAPYGEDTSVMSVKEWLKCILLTMIPCVGIVLIFVWAFSNTGNVNRRNFYKASLIVAAIVFAIYIIFWILFIAIIGISFGTLIDYL